MKKIASIKSALLIVILLMGMMFTFYGVRIQIKLGGLVILLCVFGLLWMRNLEVEEIRSWRSKDVHMILFLLVIIVIAVAVACFMLIDSGPQPFLLYSPLDEG